MHSYETLNCEWLADVSAKFIECMLSELQLDFSTCQNEPPRTASFCPVGVERLAAHAAARDCKRIDETAIKFDGGGRHQI
eukprot:SAG31_NODE_4879_length_2888_cov_1.855145_3_plen_80_part_00